MKATVKSKEARRQTQKSRRNIIMAERSLHNIVREIGEKMGKGGGASEDEDVG